MNIRLIIDDVEYALKPKNNTANTKTTPNNNCYIHGQPNTRKCPFCRQFRGKQPYIKVETWRWSWDVEDVVYDSYQFGDKVDWGRIAHDTIDNDDLLDVVRVTPISGTIDYPVKNETNKTAPFFIFRYPITQDCLSDEDWDSQPLFQYYGWFDKGTLSLSTEDIVREVSSVHKESHMIEMGGAKLIFWEGNSSNQIYVREVETGVVFSWDTEGGGDFNRFMNIMRLRHKANVGCDFTIMPREFGFREKYTKINKFK